MMFAAKSHKLRDTNPEFYGKPISAVSSPHPILTQPSLVLT